MSIELESEILGSTWDRQAELAVEQEFSPEAQGAPETLELPRPIEAFLEQLRRHRIDVEESEAEDRAKDPLPVSHYLLRNEQGHHQLYAASLVEASQITAVHDSALIEDAELRGLLISELGLQPVSEEVLEDIPKKDSAPTLAESLFAHGIALDTAQSAEDQPLHAYILGPNGVDVHEVQLPTISLGSDRSPQGPEDALAMTTETEPAQAPVREEKILAPQVWSGRALLLRTKDGLGMYFKEGTDITDELVNELLDRMATLAERNETIEDLIREFDLKSQSEAQDTIAEPDRQSKRLAMLEELERSGNAELKFTPKGTPEEWKTTYALEHGILVSFEQQPAEVPAVVDEDDSDIEQASSDVYLTDEVPTDIVDQPAEAATTHVDSYEDWLAAPQWIGTTDGDDVPQEAPSTFIVPFLVAPQPVESFLAPSIPSPVFAEPVIAHDHDIHTPKTTAAPEEQTVAPVVEQHFETTDDILETPEPQVDSYEIEVNQQLPVEKVDAPIEAALEQIAINEDTTQPLGNVTEAHILQPAILPNRAMPLEIKAIDAAPAFTRQLPIVTPHTSVLEPQSLPLPTPIRRSPTTPRPPDYLAPDRSTVTARTKATTRQQVVKSEAGINRAQEGAKQAETKVSKTVETTKQHVQAIDTKAAMATSRQEAVQDTSKKQFATTKPKQQVAISEQARAQRIVQSQRSERKQEFLQDEQKTAARTVQERREHTKAVTPRSQATSVRTQRAQVATLESTQPATQQRSQRQRQQRRHEREIMLPTNTIESARSIILASIHRLTKQASFEQRPAQLTVSGDGDAHIQREQIRPLQLLCEEIAWAVRDLPRAAITAEIAPRSVHFVPTIDDPIERVTLAERLNNAQLSLSITPDLAFRYELGGAA